MKTLPTSGYRPIAYSIPRAPANVRASVFASMMLGLTLNASIISVFGSSLGYFSSAIGNVFAASMLMGLIVINWFRARKFSLVALPLNLKLATGVLCTMCILVGFYGYSASFVPSREKLTIILKTGGVLITFAALASASRHFNFKEVSLGLKIFAFIELLGCVAVFRLDSDVNANAIAVRATVASMCLFALLGSNFLRYLAVLGCLAFSVKLGCRTSSMAFIGALTFIYLEKRTRDKRGFVLVFTVFAFMMAIITLPFILSGLEQLALAYLGSDNPIARFFLHDKTSAKVSGDYLDRTDVWVYAWEFIREKPFMGYGLGTEKAFMGRRCHNAFMSLWFEGGLFWLLAWVWFYFRSVTSLFDRRWLRVVGDSKLFSLTNLMLSYMLLAGMVESSGLASVSTPINLIFIFLTFWLFQPNRDPYNRSFAGG